MTAQRAQRLKKFEISSEIENFERDWNFRCFFAPPSMRNHRNQFSAISMGFPQILDDFPSISIDFLSFSISFTQFQSVSVNSNQFESVWLGQKRRNWLTTGRWGKEHQRNFRSSHPPRPYFLVGKSRRRDWKFRARLKISIEIENFERDWIFLIVGPSGSTMSHQPQPPILHWQAIVARNLVCP